MTSTETPPTTTAVATRDNSPRGLIEQYSGDFANVLPSHIKAVTWVRVAQGALKKGKKVAVRVDGKTVERFELEIAAANNPAAFLSALLDAARQGLEPGTEQYYLTPRKVNGQLEILGMRGYQGEIELIYRAGAVSSVVAEVVYTGDKFTYQPGPGRVPEHEIDWDADDRGQLRLVYAYAVMKDGAISRVVVLNNAAIERIKSFAQGTSSQYSPWNTSTEAMWLKSGIHQLQKWVPTSAEYITTQVRAVREGSTPEPVNVPPMRMQQDMPDVDPNNNGDTIVDAEVVSDDPPADTDQPADGAEYHEAEATEPPPPDGITKVQSAKLHATLNGLGCRDRDRQLAVISQILNEPVDSSGKLTKAEASTVIDTLENLKDRDAFDAIFGDAPTVPQS